LLIFRRPRNDAASVVRHDTIDTGPTPGEQANADYQEGKLEPHDGFNLRAINEAMKGVILEGSNSEEKRARSISNSLEIFQRFTELLTAKENDRRQLWPGWRGWALTQCMGTWPVWSQHPLQFSLV
jgi:hypothetical protein